MKFSHLIIAPLLTSSLSAYAADIKPKVDIDTRNMWQGFYLGANTGMGSGNTASEGISFRDFSAIPSLNFPTSTAVGLSKTPNKFSSGLIAGIQVGYNFFLTRNVIIGGEADFNWSNVRNSGSFNGNQYQVIGALSTKASNAGYQREGINYLGTIRGRIGMPIGRILPFLTAGMSYLDNASIFNGAQFFGFGSFGGMGGQYTKVNNLSLGWVAGIGSEYKIDENLSIKTEYLYTQFSRASVSGYGFNTYKGTINQDFLAYDKTSSNNPNIHQLRIGLNYFPSIINGKYTLNNSNNSNYNYFSEIKPQKGMYIGVNANYGIGNKNVASFYNSYVNQPAYNLIRNIYADSVTNNNIGGVLTGVQLGYNYDLQNKFIAGIETDFEWSGIQSSTSKSASVISTNTSLIGLGYSNTDNKVQWYGSSRLRLGYSLSNLMPYVTGGIAYSLETTRDINYSTNEPFPIFKSGSNSSMLVGWAAGCGIELPINNYLTSKFEYLYTQFGSNNTSENTLSIAQDGVYADFARHNSNIDFHQMRVGLNYHFNAGEEKIVAKY